MARDRAVKERLEACGWRVVIFWECETRQPEIVARLLKSIANSPRILERNTERLEEVSETA